MNVFIYDTETNGCKFLPSTLSPQHHIIQIAIKHCATNETFQSLIQLPDGINVPQASSDIHGVYDADLLEAPTFKMVFHKLKKWTAKCAGKTTLPLVLIAHNNHGFDEPVFRKECLFYRRAIPNDWNFYDTLPMFRAVFPERADFPFDKRYNLGALHQDIVGAPLEGAHDAMADVNGLHAILQKIQDNGTTLNFNAPDFLTSCDSFDIDSDVVNLKGVGAHTSRMIAGALGAPKVTIRRLMQFVAQRNLQQLEFFLRSFLKHEKHIMTLTLTLWKLVHSKITLQDEIELVAEFPFCKNGMAFHGAFSIQSAARLQVAGFRGVTDLAVLDQYFDTDLTLTLQQIGCTPFEVAKFKNTYTRLL